MTSTTFPPIPPDTARAARAVFGGSNFYLVTGDQVNRLFHGLALENPGGSCYWPARIQAVLYLTTIFQSMETLPDEQAANALRKRIDWKYALHLPLDNPGLEAETFCSFRQWLLAEPSRQLNLQELLLRLSPNTERNGKSGARLEANQVIAKVCQISRMTWIWETINQALETLAIRKPDWLLAANLPHWYERYGRYRMSINPSGDDREDNTLALAIGADGIYLLEAISNANDQDMANIYEITKLRRVWDDQYEDSAGRLAWRKASCASCSFYGMISNPSSRAI